MLFKTLRRMIERNQIESLEEKIVFFYNNKKLKDKENKTLTRMLKEKQ